jgi:large subunit ribosomal protein L25
MTSEIQVLDVQIREQAGKGAARTTRREGQVPAVIYGAGQSPITISTCTREINKLAQKGGFRKSIFDLKLPDGTIIRAIPKEVQNHPVKDLPIHIDFLRLEKETMVTLDIPLEIVDQEKCTVLKRGGKLQVTCRRLKLRVPANKVPDSIVISLDGITGKKVIHISDIVLPEGCEPANKKDNTTILIVKAPVEK